MIPFALKSVGAVLFVLTATTTLDPFWGVAALSLGWASKDIDVTKIGKR